MRGFFYLIFDKAKLYITLVPKKERLSSFVKSTRTAEILTLVTPRVMKTLYALFAAASLTLLTPTAHATAPGTDDPTETARKATARAKITTAAKAARAVKAAKKSSSHHFRKFKAGLNHGILVLLGFEDSKAVTSPAKLIRQLHIRQQHLKTKAKMEAKARRRHTTHLFS